MSDNNVVDLETLVQQARAMAAHVPEFTQLTVPQAQAMRVVARLNPDFIQSTLITLGASDYIAAALATTVAEARKEIDEADRWTALEAEIRSLYSGVKAANLVRRYRIAQRAFHTYQLAGQLVRLKQHAALLPYVQQMRRFMKLGRKRKRKGSDADPQE